MKLERPDWYFAITIVVSVMLAIAPTYIVQDWITANSNVLTIFFIAVTICIMFLWFVYRRYNIIIISNGLDYIISEIRNYSKSGGVISSTAIFEDSIHDAVTEYLEKNIDSIKSNFIFKRLVLLDNPALEFVWIKGFLNLKNDLFTPIIYHVTALKRPIVSKIIKSVPNLSIVIFYNKKQDVVKSYLGFKGGTRPFGISIVNTRISKSLEKYLNSFVNSANKLEDTSNLPSEPSFSNIFFYNIISLLEDESFSKRIGDKDDILLIGAFGSSGLSLQKRVNDNSGATLEGDLDLLFYLSRHANVDQVKDRIVSSLKNEFDELREVIDTNNLRFNVEISNMDNKYYCYRDSIHIDIQLHQAGNEEDEGYYIDESKARLLGYSIFDDSFYVIYSKNDISIKEHGILLPDVPIERDKRIDLVLNSQEYGVRTAKNRILMFEYKDTDPKRLLWIVLQNYIWALTGYRTRVKSELVDYVNSRIWVNNLDSFSKEILDELNTTSVVS